MLLIQQLNKSNIYLMGYFYCPVFIIYYSSRSLYSKVILIAIEEFMLKAK